MAVDRETVGAYVAYGWAEVIRHALEELARNSSAATPDERALLGTMVHMQWHEADGELSSAIGRLVAVQVDHDGRWATTDDGFGFDTNAMGFVMRPCTLEELTEVAR